MATVTATTCDATESCSENTKMVNQRAIFIFLFSHVLNICWIHRVLHSWVFALLQFEGIFFWRVQWIEALRKNNCILLTFWPGSGLQVIIHSICMNAGFRLSTDRKRNIYPNCTQVILDDTPWPLAHTSQAALTVFVMPAFVLTLH